METTTTFEPEAPCLAEPLQGVDGLARLAHADGERPVVEDGAAVPELTGDVDLGGQPGPLLDGVLGHQRGMIAAAAGHDADPLHVTEVLETQAGGRVEDQGAVRADGGRPGYRPRHRAARGSPWS